MGSDILAKLPDVAASTGSACHAGVHCLSPVLEAMGVEVSIGVGAIRFSLGRTTTGQRPAVKGFEGRQVGTEQLAKTCSLIEHISLT
jgi:hypothetical protein